MTAIVWYRRDLRVHDLPALRAALDEHDAVVPVFCFDDGLLDRAATRRAIAPGSCSSACADLDASLRDRGGHLYVRRGRPERELRGAGAREPARRVVHVTP